MDYLLIIGNLILIFLALIIHQKKEYKSQKLKAANLSFYIGLLFFMALGLGHVLIGEDLPIKVTYLDSGSLLAIIYLGYLYYLIKREK